MSENLEQSSGAFSLVVIDDDPAIRLATVRLLRNTGYTVTDAPNGIEGEKLIRQIRPDLVLMDVELGDADGRVICKTLREEAELKDTFFVLISGMKTSSDDQARGLEEGADGYIVRPVENRELLARVKAYLRIAAAEHKRRSAMDALKKSEEENRMHMDDLKRFNKMATGRELKMIELKQQINALCRELGRKEPYTTEDIE